MRDCRLFNAKQMTGSFGERALEWQQFGILGEVRVFHAGLFRCGTGGILPSLAV